MGTSKFKKKPGKAAKEPEVKKSPAKHYGAGKVGDLADKAKGTPVAAPRSHASRLYGK